MKNPIRMIGKPVILFVSHDSRLNGAPKSLLLSVQSVPEGLKAVVLLYWDGPLRQKLEEMGVEFRILGGSKGISRWAIYANWIRNFFQICWFCYFRNVKIVYANSIGRSQSLLAARIFGIPTVLHLREMRLRPKGLGLRRNAKFWITGYCGDRRIAVSESAEIRFRSVGFCGGSSSVIYNGIKASDFPEVDLGQEEARNMLGLELDGPLVGHIGSASWRKGLDVFLQMAVKLIEDVPSVSFLVVGIEKHKEEWMKRELGAVISALEGRLHLFPVRSDVAVCFRAIDVFCNLSRAEPFARVNLEAAILRVPSVVSNIDGNREFHRSGETGWIVPTEDAEGTRVAVREALSASEEASRRAENAYRRVVENFSAEKYESRIRNVIFELLKGNAGETDY